MTGSRKRAIRKQKWILEFLEGIAPTYPDVRNCYLQHAKDVLDELQRPETVNS